MDVLHGVPVADPYRWLEDGKSPEVVTWTSAQDALARHYLDSIPSRSSLNERIKELLAGSSIEPYYRGGDRLFYRRRDPGRNKSILYVLDPRTGERVLVDPNNWAGHKSFLSYWPSPDGKFVALAVANSASDDSHVEIVDVGSGSLISTVLGARYRALDWAADSSGVYFTFFPSNSTSSDVFSRSEVRFHAVPDRATSDLVVAPSTGRVDVFQNVTASEDGKWLLLRKEIGATKSSLFYRDAHRMEPWRVLADERDAQFDATAHGGYFYIQTNEGAPHGRLFRTSTAKPDRAAWEELVGERRDAVLDSFAICGGRLLLKWRHPEGSELELRSIDGKDAKNVALPGVGVATLPVGSVFSKDAYFSFESYVHPPEIIHLNADTGELTSVAKSAVPFKSDDYVVENVPYRSADGTASFLRLVHGRNITPGNNAVTLLYGYGSHGKSSEPTYRSTLPAWLERGEIYAEAVVRGGGEYGDEWHRQATGLTKQKTFDDFIAAAQELVRLGWTSPERLGMIGSSAGGLLVTAVATQKPDLFKFAIAEASLTDMIRYPLKGIGNNWMVEYGDPSEIAGFRALLAYSPYHNVRGAVRYPAMLLLFPEADDRVDPMHTKKFAAAIQNAAPGNVALLDIERGTGHNLTDDQAVIAAAKSDMYAFALSQASLPRRAADGQRQP